MSFCLECGKTPKRNSYKYCSNICQRSFEYHTYISEWKEGKRIFNTKNVSRFIKRYLKETFGEKCSICGWQQKHPVTGNVPLEVDHKDSNPSNNSIDNMRLLCPNCHSLTPNFRNLNKGKGRSWRLATNKK